MQQARFCWVVVLIALGFANGPIAGAADFSHDFLKEARGRGYGRVMVEYLTDLQTVGKLPSELKETFDLEMSKALRVAAANDAFNKEEREKWQTESKERLEKFLKEHKDHPEVASAQSTFGDLSLERGLGQIRQSRGTQDKELKMKHLAEARKAFDEARPRFADAAARYEKRFEEAQANFEALSEQKGVPQGKLRKAESQAEDVLFDFLDNRSKVGLVEFYFAQTIEDPKDKARAEALAKAAKQFDDIYQDNRESLIGLTAHAWHGKAVDEAGDFELAGDIYEEVLANVPDNLTVETGMEGLFAQVFYFKALLEIKKGKGDDFGKTAPDWLRSFRAWRKYDGYQGINLEYAKALRGKLEKANEADKRKIRLEIKNALNEIKKVQGEHQNDAILMALELSKGAGGPGGMENASEAIALGEEAAKSGDWDGAEANYKEALELAGKSTNPKDKKLVPDIEAALEQVRYRRAVAMYGEEKYEEVIETCGKIAKNKSSATGPQAAALAVSACLTLYAKAQPDGKEKALKRLTTIADYTIESWPDKAEADDARIAMGQAKLVQGQFEDAIKVFQEVNPRSERFGVGLFLAGQTHWRLYTMGEKQDPSKGPARAEHAESNLTQAVEALRKRAAEKPEEPPRQLPEAELLLGEVYVERGNGAKAVDLLAPQVALLIAAKPKEVDNMMLRTFLAGVRAFMAAGDMKKASDTVQSLVEFAPDQPQINKILVGFMTMMQQEWKKANAAVIEARDGNDLSAKEAADAQIKTASEMLGKLIDKLIARQQIDVGAQLFMAKTAMDIERPDLGEPLYRKLLEKADAGDPTVDKKIVPVCRAQLLGIVRRKGDYEEALKQVDKLLEEFPNALPYMMERGRILQAWAEKDDTKFQDAVQHWINIRGKLQRLPQKPPEFYEVNYNAALCLYIDSQKTKDPKKAQDAAKVLNALLFMNPKLNGPDTVAQYNELLKKVDPAGHKKRMEVEKKKAKEAKEAAKAAKETAAK